MSGRLTWMRRELRISLRLLATAWLLALVLVMLAACGGGGEHAQQCDELEAAWNQGRFTGPLTAPQEAALRACGIDTRGTQPVNCRTHPERCQ